MLVCRPCFSCVKGLSRATVSVCWVTVSSDEGLTTGIDNGEVSYFTSFRVFLFRSCYPRAAPLVRYLKVGFLRGRKQGRSPDEFLLVLRRHLQSLVDCLQYWRMVWSSYFTVRNFRHKSDQTIVTSKVCDELSQVKVYTDLFTLRLFT